MHLAGVLGKICQDLFMTNFLPSQVSLLPVPSSKEFPKAPGRQVTWSHGGWVVIFQKQVSKVIPGRTKGECP